MTETLVQLSESQASGPTQSRKQNQADRSPTEQQASGQKLEEGELMKIALDTAAVINAKMPEGYAFDEDWIARRLMPTLLQVQGQVEKLRTESESIATGEMSCLAPKYAKQ